MGVRVQINGETREFAESMTLDGLIDFLGLAVERVAIERNRDVVRRKDWASTELEEGDNIEIIHFVGGG
jgi:thiamine biosynthesis protein ThiS